MGVILVRHPPVAKAWTGRCYGVSDMGWSRGGGARARDLAAMLAARPIDRVIHSGLIRTRRLADRLALPAIEDRRWRERDFGSWEGRSWQAIWRETGAAMDRMLTDPEGFRPGGGETTAELAARALAAWQALPADGLTLVIAHGGPIAALRCAQAGAPPAEIARYIPACGAIIEFSP